MAKYWKVTWTFLPSQSINWLFENFSRQTIIELSNWIVRTVLGQSRVCLHRNSPVEEIH